MNSFDFYIVLALITGWCLKCIYDDVRNFLAPTQASILNGAATVTMDPTLRKGGPSTVAVAGILNAAILGLNILASWLEQVQTENPRLPEECLTAQQWIQAALNKVEQMTGVDPSNLK